MLHKRRILRRSSQFLQTLPKSFAIPGRQFRPHSRKIQGPLRHRRHRHAPLLMLVVRLLLAKYFENVAHVFSERGFTRAALFAFAFVGALACCARLTNLALAK